MPNIEIISIRFNLGKDNDRRLFQILQERPDSGKRNEFLKQVLSDCLLKERPDAKQALSLLKSRSRSLRIQEESQEDPNQGRRQITTFIKPCPSPLLSPATASRAARKATANRTRKLRG